MAEVIVVPTMNPIPASILSFLAGHFLGTATDRLIKIAKMRADITSKLGVSGSAKSSIDSIIHLALGVSVISLGTDFITNAMPWMTEATSSYALFLFGLFQNCNELNESARNIWDFIVMDSPQ